MADKKTRLLERAKETTRRPRPERLIDPANKKQGYRMVTVSLYVPEADWIDHISQLLKQIGNPKANRSLVVREAIYQLQQELTGKSPEEVLQHFIGQHVKRNKEAHSTS